MLNETSVLEDLEERELVTYNEESGLPLKVEANRHLREKEVCAVILCHIVEDVRISNRELERRTGINARTIGKYRSGDCFLRLLNEHTNKIMITVRAVATEKLLKGLLDENMSDSNMAKFIQQAYTHSSEMARLSLAKQLEKPVDIADLLRELEGMD